MDVARASLFRFDDVLGSAPDAMGSDSGDDELTPHSDNDNDDDWDFADGPVDFHIDALASPPQGFDAIRELRRLAGVAVPEEGSDIFIFALQNLNAIMERDSAVAAKTVA